MRSPKLWFVVTLTALLGAYAALTLYMGHRLAQETALYSQALSERPDIQVARLEYDREFHRGTLHYDLTWRPAADDPEIEAIRFAGALEFRHGPWTGAAGGFALASSEGAIALPEEIRRFLPQYPAEAPVLRMVAVATFGGDLDARFTAADYRGDVVLPDEQPMRLALTGLTGRVRTDARLERVLLEGRLQDLAVQIAGIEDWGNFRVLALHVESDSLEARPWVRTGTTRISLDRAFATSSTQHMAINDFATRTETWIDGHKLHSNSTSTMGTTRVNAHELLGGEMVVALREVDVDALSALAAEANWRRADAASQDDMAWARPHVERILAGRPSLTIERLNLSLGGADDLTGRVELAFAGEQPLVLDHPESIAQALRIAAEVRMSHSALRQVAAVMAVRDLPPEATEAERAAAADTFYREALAGLELLPFLSVGDEHVAAAVMVSEGRLLVGGIEFMDVTAILVLMLAGLL
jgi:hypothetical protein